MKRLIVAGLVSIATLAGSIAGTERAIAETMTIADRVTPSQGCEVTIDRLAGTIKFTDLDCVVSIIYDENAQATGTIVGLPSNGMVVAMSELSDRTVIKADGMLVVGDSRATMHVGDPVVLHNQGQRTLVFRGVGERVFITFDVNDVTATGLQRSQGIR